MHLFQVETFPRKHRAHLHLFLRTSLKKLPLHSRSCNPWHSLQSLILVGGLLPCIDFLLYRICSNVFFPWNMFWRNSPRLLISSQPNFKSKTGNSKWFNTSFMFIKQTIVSSSKNIWMWEVKKKFNLKKTSHAVSNFNLFISRLNIKSDYVLLWSQATVPKTPNNIMQHPTRIKSKTVTSHKRNQGPEFTTTELLELST